jgi:hypothetical protein
MIFTNDAWRAAYNCPEHSQKPPPRCRNVARLDRIMPGRKCSGPNNSSITDACTSGRATEKDNYGRYKMGVIRPTRAHGGVDDGLGGGGRREKVGN